MADVEQPTGFWSKIKRLFSRRQTPDGTTHALVPASRSLFRPWRRNDPAIAQLQKDYDTLMQLMLAVRDHLDQQAHQQQELSDQLVKISEAEVLAPQEVRTPDEAIRAVAQQMAYQSQQHNRISNILERLSDASGQQGRSLQALTDRLESMEHHGQLIAENTQSMGIVMQSVSRNGEQHAQNLTTIRQQLDQHGQLHALAHRQSERLMILMIITLALAAAALVTAIVIGAMIARRTTINHSTPTTRISLLSARSSAL